MKDIALPWYVTLLGKRPRGEAFDRLVSQLGLSSDDEPESRVGWYENKEGVSVTIRSARVHAIQFFSSENPHFTGFSEPLPLGLSFAMNRDSVHAVLGEPDHVLSPRPDGNIPHGGIDRFDAHTCVVVAAYSASSGRLEVLGFECMQST